VIPKEATTMAGRPTCPDCGVELMGPGGHCPRCLLEAGLEGDSLSVGGGGAVGVTMALESTGPAAGACVLEALASSVGPVPRVLLRDTDGGPEPPARPGSNAMPAPADRAGRLQLLGEIARGGMGAVLKGRDADLGRDLAVKVLLERHRDDPELIRRFVEEAQIAGQLQHPGIVPVYELGAFADRRPFFTMKLVKGRTLAEILRDRPDAAHDLPRLLATFLQVAQTVAYAHARGVIHRDLKPSNVMVGSFGEVQVMDWGLAKVLPRGGAVDDASAGKRDAHETVIATARSGGDDSDLSRAGSVLGTPAYMAPEQARGEVDRLDERCDVFALGSILCEVLTRAPAFSGRTSGEIQRRAARGEVTDALTRLESSAADPELLALTRDCLAPEAEDRPRDAGVVAGRLSAHLTGVQERLRAAELARATESARAAEAEGRVKAERRARRMTAALAAAVIGLIALGTGGFVFAQRQRAAWAARTAEAVDAALAGAARLAAEARAEPAGVSAKWAQAIAQARSCQDMVKHGEADEATCCRVDLAVAALVRERDETEERARREAADRRLLDRVAEIRGASAGSYDDDDNGSATDAAYTDAFRAAGYDPDGPPAQVGAAIRARPAAVAQSLAAALDDWAAIRRGWGSNAAGADRLAEIARAADPDPWRCALRAALSRTEKAGRLDELRRLKETARLDELGPGSLDLLGRALLDAGDPAAAESVLREAQRHHPGDLWINHDLGRVCQRLLKHDEAIRCYYAARAIRPEMGHWLAVALFNRGEYDEAIAVVRGMTRRWPENGKLQQELYLHLTYRSVPSEEAKQALAAAVAAERAATRSRPGDATAHLRLGDALSRQEKPDEAEAAFREAIRLSPDFAGAYSRLGMLLRIQGRPAEAEAPLRTAIRLQPDWAVAHQVLGGILWQQGRLAEAETEAREAVRLGPDNGVNNITLGQFLMARGKFAAAEAEYRETIRMHPDFATGWSFLGRVLEHQGKLDEAEAALREAVRLREGTATQRALGNMLRRQGRMEEALASLRRAAALPTGPARAPELASTIAADIRRTERQAALAPRLPAILHGDDRPTDAAEGLDLARLCLDRDRPAAAARLFADALAADPGRADDRTALYREDAARAAAMAGSGRGRDDPPPDTEAQARLRRLALGWLEEELAAWKKAVDPGDPKAHRQAGNAITRWKTDPGLAGVREPEALAALPEAERAEWRSFWDEVDALLQRAAKARH
jgi:serine/threonine-protein kinase